MEWMQIFPPVKNKFGCQLKILGCESAASAASKCFSGDRSGRCGTGNAHKNADWKNFESQIITCQKFLEKEKLSVSRDTAQI